MGVQRSFTAQCDKCGFHADHFAYKTATELRKKCLGNLWTISGNKFTCPTCNKKNPEYVRYYEMVANNESN
jgi:hypothetical protein